MEEVVDGQMSRFNSSRREEPISEFKTQTIAASKSKASLLKNKPSSTKGSAKRGMVPTSLMSSNQKSQ